MEALVTSTVFLGVIAVPLGLILLFVRETMLFLLCEDNVVVASFILAQTSVELLKLLKV